MSLEEKLKDHDGACAIFFDSLQQLGCFDEEFACYGTTYQDSAGIKFFVSSNAMQVNQKIYQLQQQDIYATPIQSKYSRRQVPSGEYNDIYQSFKLALAKQLQAAYTPAFYEGLGKISNVLRGDQALPIIQELQKKLTGSFDYDALQIFRGLLQTAFAGKKLAHSSFYRTEQWIQRQQENMQMKRVARGQFKRTYSGFAYYDNGKISYYYNALPMLTVERRNEWMSRGHVVSPLFQKEYYFHTNSELPEVERQFGETLQFRMDGDYMQLLQAIRQLSGPISAGSLDQNLEMTANRKEARAIAFYKNFWHMI